MWLHVGVVLVFACFVPTTFAALNSAAWTPSASNLEYLNHPAIASDGKIVVTMGGSDVSGTTRGVQVIRGDSAKLYQNAPWSSRDGAAAAFVGNSLLMVGGRTQESAISDAWFSNDYGATWHEVLQATPFEARFLHQLVVSNGDVFLVGGTDGDISFSDVWVSRDQGASWALVTDEAPWPARFSHRVVDAEGVGLVLAAGCCSLRDVWVSQRGGVRWHRATATAPWSSRASPALVAAAGGKLFLAGGVTDSGAMLHDAWMSHNLGATWTQLSRPPFRGAGVALLVNGGRVMWLPHSDASNVAVTGHPFAASASAAAATTSVTTSSLPPARKRRLAAPAAGPAPGPMSAPAPGPMGPAPGPASGSGGSCNSYSSVVERCKHDRGLFAFTCFDPQLRTVSCPVGELYDPTLQRCVALCDLLPQNAPGAAAPAAAGPGSAPGPLSAAPAPAPL